jgi:UPF0042 nucleotide-binding protein
MKTATFTNKKNMIGEHRREIFIVTGLSGSGKSSVMCSLEDLGFYCVDNFPASMISSFLDLVFNSHPNLVRVALGIDVRGASDDFILEIKKIKKYLGRFNPLKIIFLNARDETLVKRFQETRRTHPLAKNITLTEAIKKEREILMPLEALSDQIHHTDRSTIHDLRRWVGETFSDTTARDVVVTVISFGFKYGVPVESNLVYDLRFLPNPYFVPALKKLDGRDRRVQDYLFCKKEVTDYWDRLVDFLHYQLERYFHEGRFFANISIGCTGGKHRSVSFVERLCAQKWNNVRFLRHHRDVGKE